jgi:aminoglycoside 3-N-acetyltransferase
VSEKAVAAADVSEAIRGLRLSGLAVCLHVSLRSFGRVAGGADAIIDAFLDERCTVLVPTFSWDSFAVPPPDAAAMRPRRNGCDYEVYANRSAGGTPAYWPESRLVDADMGVLPRAVLERGERVRGSHPLASFAAIGPAARTLLAQQTPTDPFAPLRELAQQNGFVALLGVGLTRMTLLHLAEQCASRTPFQRWALNREGRPMLVAVGGCSEGFENFGTVLAPLEHRRTVRNSCWRVFRAKDTLTGAVRAILADPLITHCGRPCVRCDDAVAGGPIPAPPARA